MTKELRWPVVTVPIANREPWVTSALPVRLGCGLDGDEIGYVSGGRWPAGMKITSPTKPEEHGDTAEKWVRLDPDALARIPAVIAAVQRRLHG